MFDVGIIQWLQAYSTPWLDRFFTVFTQAGSHYAYMVILPFIYWAVDRQVGLRLAGLFLASMWLNGLLKEYLVMPRPDPALVRHMVTEPSPGFPSGHAQGATTLWGYLAVTYRTPWLIWAAVALIALMAVSRMYLGVHYLGDVIGGVAIGALMIAGFVWLTRRRVGAALSLGQRTLLAVAVPLLLYPLYQTGTSEQILGFFVGLFTADLLAGRTVPYRERVSVGRQLIKLAIGYAGFFALVALHVMYVPVGLPSVLGYSLIAVWVVVGAPALFRRFGLAGDAPAVRLHADARGLRRYLAAAAVVLVLVGGSTLFVRQVVPVVERPPILRVEGVMVIGHRGTTGLAPENTLPAFQTALEHGAHILEMDVWRTRDGEVVVIHDETVDRTTEGRGRVGEMTLAEIRNLDAGYRFTPDDGRTYPRRGQGIRIPTLGEVLTTFPGAAMLVEIKENAPGAVDAVLAVIAAAGAQDRVMIASFHDAVVHRVRELAPQIPTSYTRGEVLRLVILQRLGLAAFASPAAEALQVPEWYGPLRVAHPGLARVARRQGIALHVWTINETEAMYRVIGLGANGVITGYPDRLQRVLAALAGGRMDRVFY